jgi:hypothetical protein
MHRPQTRHLRRTAGIAVFLLFSAACTTQLSTPASTPTPFADTATPQTLQTSVPEIPAVSPTQIPEGSTLEPTSDPPTPTLTLEPTSTPVFEMRYSLRFDATWSAESHPADFPSNPHFSGLIGGTHKTGTYLWQVGKAASPGIQTMAEIGAKQPLNSEVNAMIENGDACELISGDGIGISPGSTEVNFTASVTCPVVSVVSMIAPSPDWFVGVSALNLLQDGVWVDGVVVELLPYDAGTDDGASYSSVNAATNPQTEITLFASAPLLVDGSVPSLGRFTFVRLGE